MRVVNIMIIAALILATSLVYKIKFDSALQAEKVDKLRGELRHERDAIAALRAEWARLDTPSRIQNLAERFLPNLQPAKPTQFTDFDHLPPRPLVPPMPPANSNAVGAMIAPLDPDVTGSLPAQPLR